MRHAGHHDQKNTRAYATKVSRPPKKQRISCLVWRVNTRIATLFSDSNLKSYHEKRNLLRWSGTARTIPNACGRWTALIYNHGYPSKMDLTSKNMEAETRKHRKSIAYPPSRRNRSKTTISLNCIKNAPQRCSIRKERCLELLG